MAYATQNDLIPRRLTEANVLQLTDDSNAGTINTQLVTDVLTEASGKVDSYCRMRYATPLQASEEVKGLTLDIAVYLLFLRRGRVNDERKLAYDNAIAFLVNVSTGKATLDQPVNATPQSAAPTGGALATSVEEKFNDDNLEGYI